MNRVGLRDVAKLAGVALSSASRVLSDHPEVSPAMRSRVLLAAEQLGYEHNSLWDGLRSGVTRTVGMVVRDISSAHWAEIALGAEMFLQRNGYSMLLANSRGQADLDVSQIRTFNGRQVDGLIVSPNDVSDPATLATLDRLRVPFVAIDRDLPVALGGSTVLIDHQEGATAAVAHLLELGHRSIGFVSPPANFRPAHEVRQALERMCSARGASAAVEEGQFGPADGESAAGRLLDSEDGVTALIVGSNQMVPGVLSAVQSRRLRIPADMSLVAFEDLPLLSAFDPPISIVSRQPRLVGERSAELLLRRLEDGEPEVHVVPTVYVRRHSCGAAPA